MNANITESRSEWAERLHDSIAEIFGSCDQISQAGDCIHCPLPLCIGHSASKLSLISQDEWEKWLEFGDDSCQGKFEEPEVEEGDGWGDYWDFHHERGEDINE